MAASAKIERDLAATKLSYQLNRMQNMARENQLTVALAKADTLHTEAIRLHLQFCAKKGEDHKASAHGEWLEGLDDSYNEAVTAAEEKVEAIQATNLPPVQTPKIKFNQVKNDLSVLEVQINLRIENLERALRAAEISDILHQELVSEKQILEKDLHEGYQQLGKTVLEMAQQAGEAEDAIQGFSCEPAHLQVYSGSEDRNC